MRKLILTLLLGCTFSATVFAQSLSLVAELGNLSPDGNGIFTVDTSFPFIGDGGHVVFLTALVGTQQGTSDNVVLIRSRAGVSEVLARHGDPLPDGLGTYSFRTIVNSVMGVLEDGSVILFTDADGTSSDALILFDAEGEASVIARESFANNDNYIEIYVADPTKPFYALPDGTLFFSGYTRVDGTLTACIYKWTQLSGLERFFLSSSEITPDYLGRFSTTFLANHFRVSNNQNVYVVADLIPTAGGATYRGIVRVGESSREIIMRSSGPTPDNSGTFISQTPAILDVGPSGEIVFKAVYQDFKNQQHTGIFFRIDGETERLFDQGDAFSDSVIGNIALGEFTFDGSLYLVNQISDDQRDVIVKKPGHPTQFLLSEDKPFQIGNQTFSFEGYVAGFDSNDEGLLKLTGAYRDSNSTPIVGSLTYDGTSFTELLRWADPLGNGTIKAAFEVSIDAQAFNRVGQVATLIVFQDDTPGIAVTSPLQFIPELPDAPQISIQEAGGMLMIELIGVPGESYQVQHIVGNPDFVNGWADVGQVFHGVGPHTYSENAPQPSDAEPRFFRGVTVE